MDLPKATVKWTAGAMARARGEVERTLKWNTTDQYSPPLALLISAWAFDKVYPVTEFPSFDLSQKA